MTVMDVYSRLLEMKPEAIKLARNATEYTLMKKYCLYRDVLSTLSHTEFNITFGVGEEIMVSHQKEQAQRSDDDWRMYFSDRYAQARHAITREFRDIDFEFKVVLLPDGDDVLLYWIGEHHLYKALFEDNWFEDYAYYNSSDKPDQYTQEEWDYIGDRWGRLVKRNFHEKGLIFHLVDWSDFDTMVFEFESLQKPSDEKRVMSAAKEIAIMMEDHRLITTKETMNYSKSIDNVKQNTQELKPFILLYDR